MVAVPLAVSCLFFYRLGWAGPRVDPRCVALLDLPYATSLARKAGAEGLIALNWGIAARPSGRSSRGTLEALRALLYEAEQRGLKVFPTCDLFGVEPGKGSEEMACKDKWGGTVYWCLSNPKVLESGDKALLLLLRRLGDSPALGGVYVPPTPFRGGYCARCKAARARLPGEVSIAEFRQRLLTSVLERRRGILKSVRPDLLMVVHADIGEDGEIVSLPNAAKAADVLVVGGSGRSLLDRAFEYDLLRSTAAVSGRQGWGAVTLDGPCPGRALGLALMRAGGVVADGLHSLLQPVEKGFELSFVFGEVAGAFKGAREAGRDEPRYEVAVVTSLADLYNGGGGRAKALYRALLEAGFPPSAEYASYLPRRAGRYKALVVACEGLSDGAARAVARAVWSGATAFIFGSCGTRDGRGKVRERWAFDGLLPVQRAGWSVERTVSIKPTDEGRRVGLKPVNLEELLSEPPVESTPGGPPAPIRLDVFRPLPGAGEGMVLATLPGGRPAIQSVRVGEGRLVLIGLYGPVCPSDLSKWGSLLSDLFRALLPRPRLEVLKPRGLLDLALGPLGGRRFSLQILNLDAAPLPEAKLKLPFPARVENVKGTRARCEGEVLTLEDLGIYAKLLLSAEEPL